MNEPHSSTLVGWVALCLVPGIGGRTLSTLLEIFGSPNAVFEAPATELKSVNRLGAKVLEAIQAIDLPAVEAQINAWQAQGIELLTWQDERYPAPLLTLPDRPPLLFARGNLAQAWGQVVAIVGTREPDVQAAHLAETMAQELAARGWLVVSGLARGIDAAAHRGGVQGGRTVAMLGCGVDEIFPMQNRPLAQRIQQKGGALYAEVPPQTPPSVGTLMARNRLIAGSAKVTIVMQAGIESGSMEAARRARQGGRHVLTIDYPEYSGNQALLRMEALPLPPNFNDWTYLAALLESLPDPPRQLGLFDDNN